MSCAAHTLARRAQQGTSSPDRSVKATACWGEHSSISPLDPRCQALALAPGARVADEQPVVTASPGPPGLEQSAAGALTL